MRDDGIIIIIERHKGDGHYRVQEVDASSPDEASHWGELSMIIHKVHPEDTDIAVWDGESNGTRYMIDAMLNEGKLVHVSVQN